MRITILTIAAVLTVAAAPALAADARAAAVRQISVKLGDLDLADPAGVRAAIARLSRAAAVVCAIGESPAVQWMADDYQRCRWQALDAAVARIRTPAAEAALARLQHRTVELAKR